MGTLRKLKKFIVGNALDDSKLSEERLSRFWGLPIMASDAVSSVAYAVEAILIALVPAIGLMATHYVGFVSLPIVLLLLILVFSYSQIIDHYPNGGGAYIVSKENFGKNASLLAATCLIVDYILTVAVSIASATDAVVAVYPGLARYKILMVLGFITFITLINLRGASESSKIFGVPTYIFILSMAALIITGFVKIFTGNLHQIAYSSEQLSSAFGATTTNLTLLLFLYAFSSGCSALTGIEAVSNTVPSFKEPSRKTAKHVLYMLAIIIVFIFGGTSFLATYLKVIPMHGATVISQMATSVFGNGVMFYILQYATSIILLLAANTSYNGLPILLSILAKDRYMPTQFSHRGTRLTFSNGIIFISFVASILLIVFNADTQKMIPLYSVGVFISFTVSQAGMFVRWFKLKEPGWQYKSLINGFGALVTLIGTFVVLSTKFIHGAWTLIIAIPALMFFMSYTRKYYIKFFKTISVFGHEYEYIPSKSKGTFPAVVLIDNMNKASMKTFDYARDLTRNVTALHISTSHTNSKRLQKQWEDLEISIPLTVIATPFRDIFTPLETFITEKEKELAPGENLTVLLPKIKGNRFLDALFHNQTTLLIQRILESYEDVVTILVPYRYNNKPDRIKRGA